MSLIVQLPTGEDEWTPNGASGVAIASALVTVGKGFILVYLSDLGYNTSLGQVVRTTLCCNVFLFSLVNHILVLKFYKLVYTCCCQEHTEQKIKNFHQLYCRTSSKTEFGARRERGQK